MSAIALHGNPVRAELCHLVHLEVCLSFLCVVIPIAIGLVVSGNLTWHSPLTTRDSTVKECDATKANSIPSAGYIHRIPRIKIFLLKILMNVILSFRNFKDHVMLKLLKRFYFIGMILCP